MNIFSLWEGAGARWAAWMWPMAWQVGLLAVLLWLVSVPLRKSPASVRYFLWLLLFVKLLVSPALSTPWSAGTILSRLPVDVVVRPASPASETQAADANVSMQALSVGRGRPIARDSARRQTGVAATALIVWAAVAAFLLLLLAVQWLRFTRRILGSCHDAPESVLRVFRKQQIVLGTSRGSLRLCDAITTPAVCGLFRPKILLPADWQDDFSEEDLASVIAHELAHVKREDLLVGWATTALTCLYWFHPAVWVANRYLRREREMACDDAALLATGREGRAYSGTILRVAERFSERVPAGVGLLGLLEMSDNLLHRVRSAGDTTRPRRIGAGSLALVLLMLTVLPMGRWNSFAARAADPALDTVAATGQAVGQTGDTPRTAGARPANGVPLIAAVLPVSGTGPADEFGDAPGKLNDLLPARLEAAGVRLVDREKVEKAAQELALGTSGLVQAETAGRLGQLVGAPVLISPKLMKLGAQWVLTVRLIDTETSEIAALEVESGTTESLQMLADKAAAQIAQRLAQFAGRRAETADPIHEAVAGLRQELAGKRLPRVVVAVPESHIGTWVPDPAGENAIVGVLADAGFDVVDVNTFMKRRESSWWLNIFHGPSEDREGTDIAVRQGLRNGGDLLHNARLEKIKENADIFIVGEAFSEYAGESLGFKSCRARIEIKAVDTATEKIAVADSRHSTAADTAELTAGKAALRTAGNELGVELARRLAAYWDTAKTADNGK